MSQPESVSRSDDVGGKKVDLPDINSKRDKEREEEEERVFIVSTKGRYGPEKLIASSHKPVSGLTDLMDSMQCMSCVSLRNS